MNTPCIGYSSPLALDILINARTFEAYEVIKARVAGYVSTGRGNRAKARAAAIAASLEPRHPSVRPPFRLLRIKNYARTGHVGNASSAFIFFV
jgi:hypothetical protein